MDIKLLYIKVFVDDLERMEALQDAEKGRLLTAMLQYAKTGAKPELRGNEAVIFPTFRLRIDQEIEEMKKKSATNAENGRKGGRPRKTIESDGNRKNQTVFKESEKSYINRTQNTEHRIQTTDGGDGARARVAAAYAEKINIQPSTACITELCAFCDELGEELCVKAMDEALDSGVRNWKYVKAILTRWKEAGYKSVADLERAEAKRRGKRETIKGNDPNAWMDEYLNKDDKFAWMANYLEPRQGEGD